MRTLQKLTVGGSAITNEGLAPLRGLPELRELDIFCSRVTDSGIENLKIALPHLRIYR